MKKNKFIDMDNVRGEEQRKVMEEIEHLGICPFCSQHLSRFHKKPIIKQTRHWLLTTNQWPYNNRKTHMLLIAKKHAEKLSDLSPVAGKELIELSQWVEQHFKVNGGAIAMRFGDTKYSAATVKHLHVQFIEPNVKKLGPDESVVLYIGKPLKKKGVRK